MATVRIRIFASHPVAKAQYTRVLAVEEDFRLVSEEEPFEVGVFDGEANSVESVLRMARLNCPSMRVLLLSSPCEENECIRWLFQGVWGLVTYNHYEDDLARAIRQLAEGQLWFPAPVVVRWMRMDEARRPSALELFLTHREQEVMGFLVRRLSNKEIAALLRISEPTVKFHVGNIFKKLHICSRHEVSRQGALYFRSA